MDTVPTAGPSLAWLAGTVIQVDSAEASSKAFRAEAGEAVYAIQTGGTISTRPHQAVIHIHFTAGTHKARQAAACEVEGKALVILALSAIPAWGTAVEVGEELVNAADICRVAQVSLLSTAVPFLAVSPWPTFSKSQISYFKMSIKVAPSFPNCKG
jgi:hypothetical protein